MDMTPQTWPEWYDGRHINEVLFCQQFLDKHPMKCVRGRLFTVDGLIEDEGQIGNLILEEISGVLTANLSKTVANLLASIKLQAYSPPLPIETDRIHVANGTYFMDGSFSTDRSYCNNRLTVTYNPDAPTPKKWLQFLSELLQPEDIPTLQEFLGYCLLPTTKGQKMLMLIGKGGEGKSRIGLVMRSLLGDSMNTTSIQKVESNRFSRADLENKLLMVDDDTLEETMARLEAMPEPEAIPYQKDDVKWERFGILLSGILSTLNSHDLDSMDVEEHIPVMEQKIVSLVRRSWGIDGRSDLLDMIRYLAQEGYILRYQLYSEASSPEELMDETMDEDDRESTCRAWRFAQRYKGQYAPGFMAGWDIGRAAMLTRWGCYLGWITESEAVGILWDLSQKVVEELHSWREFAQSYLFGGLMWKLLCGDSSAGSYLGYLADAATDLLTGKAEQDNGQWRDCPWPAQRKIGFTL